jgi:hypothetical protein
MAGLGIGRKRGAKIPGRQSRRQREKGLGREKAQEAQTGKTRNMGNIQPHPDTRVLNVLDVVHAAVEP